MTRIRPLLLALSLTTAALVSGGSAVVAQGADSGLQRPTVGVWAASSLTEVVGQVALLWEREGGESRTNLAASSRLVPQILAGAPADLLITADRRWMEVAAAEGVVNRDAVILVARNRLVVVGPANASSADAPRANAPASIAQLIRAGSGPIALAGAEVPAGRYARQALGTLGLTAELQGRIVEGGSVRGALEWVARGEAPLGIVYATDARAEPRVQVLASIPREAHDDIEIVAGVVHGGSAPAAASEWLDLLLGVEGRAILEAGGFEAVGRPLGELDAGEPASSQQAAPLPSVSAAIIRSLLVGLVAVLLATLPAVWFGRLLARGRFAGRTALSAVLLVPLVLPPVVTGFLLLSLLGSGGVLGGALAAVGIRIPFTFTAAVIAAVVVGFPLYVVVARNAFEAVDPRYEELSWTLGIPPRRTFLQVALPLALPGIAAGAVLALARALGEFGATIVLAGNVEGETRTIALAVYALLESPGGREQIWLLVGASVAIALVALAGWEWLSSRQRTRLLDRGGS